MNEDPVVQTAPVALASENGEPEMIPKQDRKKLKKLKKRVSRLHNEGERSGLLTPSQHLEYLRIVESEATTDLGPSIHRRKGKEGIKVEGSHHRDLLAWLLNQILYPNEIGNGSSKKRKRDGTEDPVHSASIPSWACVHNPCLVKNIVVLEIQVPGEIVESYATAIEESMETNAKSLLSVPTKWFQGYMPKTISDSLLYFSPNKPKREKTDLPDIPSMANLLKELQDLTIPKDAWSQEGYPEACQTSEELPPSTLPSVQFGQKPSFVPLEEAKVIVNELGVRLKDQNEDDDLLYVCTHASDKDATDPPRVFGMDCEMVLTSTGSELARITLIQLEGIEEDQIIKTKTVFDELVKPENAVSDYLTQHSGITAKLLENVTTRLSQVQTALLHFLRPTDLLVGHSLENDLRATRFIHSNVVDTSLIFRPRNKRTKFSLRHLSAALLKRTIQTGSHCSEEDAKATLDLAVRRAWRGDTFAMAETEERQFLLSSLTSQSTGVCIGPTDWIQSHVTNNANGIHALGYESTEECKKATLAWLKGRRKADFVWTKLAVNEKDESKSVDALKSLLVSSPMSREGVCGERSSPDMSYSSM
jgi:DNA polymerase III epsilon subunit-like protein